MVSNVQIWKDLASYRHDKAASTEKFRRCTVDDEPEEACKNANAVFVHTDWNTFNDGKVTSWEVIGKTTKLPKLLIYRHANPKARNMEKFGFKVLEIGKKN